MIILDTDVFSLLMRGDPSVSDWAYGLGSGVTLATTAVTVGEVRYGIHRLPQGRRRVALTESADALFADLADRILPYDCQAAEGFGLLVAQGEASGRPIARSDAQIASIALRRRATLATRNTRDFAGLGLDLEDPLAG